MKRDKKEKVVEVFHEKFSRVKAIVLTDYRGLNTAALSELRNRLREESVEYRVVKNTLVSRAAEGTDAAVLKDHLSGPCGMAISYDSPVAPAKVLVKFNKDNPNLEIRAGLVEGRFISAEEVTALSKLPSRDELLAQLLSVFNGPARSFVTVLNAVPRSLLLALQAIKTQKEESPKEESPKEEN